MEFHKCVLLKIIQACLFEIKVNSVAAVNIWRATVGPFGIPYSDVWWAKDSHTNYVE